MHWISLMISKKKWQTQLYQQQGIRATTKVLVLCKYCIVLDTKGLLFSGIYVNIVLFSRQRPFVFKHLCKYCIVLDTKGLLFSSIYVNIVLFSTQRVFCFQASMYILYCSRHKGSFVFKHLCKYFALFSIQRVFCFQASV